MAGVLPSRPAALLEPEESLTESRALDRPGELLLREVTQTRLEAPETIPEPCCLAGPGDLILAVLHHPSFDARQPLAERSQLPQLGPDLAAEVREALVDPLEP